MNEELNDQQKIHEKIINQWYNGVRIRHKAHFVLASKYERRNLWFGFPIVILTAITGTSIFASFESSPEPWMKILVGCLSILAAVLASLQTFLGYNQEAEQHKNAATKFGALRRELEERISLDQYQIDKIFIEDFRKRWDSLEQESPNIPSIIYDKYKHYYERKKL